MNKFLFAFTILATSLLSACFQMKCLQTHKFPTIDTVKFNFGFEDVERDFPLGWIVNSDDIYISIIDSLNAHSGNYSAMIQDGDIKAGGKMVIFYLPKTYRGQEITVSCYIKTEDVTDGYAGLFINLHPVTYDIMNDRGIIGTTNWTKYETTLPLYPDYIETIMIGGILTGRGKMWVDDFKVTIDGKEIYKKLIVPADKDREFDNGSTIEIPDLSERQVDNLALLGRLWGFMKYHHPSVGAGNYNWDYELFRILPEYFKTENKNSRDRLLLRWIRSYGNIISQTKPVPIPDDAFLKPNLSWLEDNDISPDLKKAIWHIYLNRNQGDNYYIQMFPHVKNPDFSSENSYSNMQYPDAGFRLLSLYRYWNMIQYYFPEKYLADKNWNDILREYIPIFISAKDELEYELAALRIICDINDTHANLWEGGDKIDSLRGNNFAPFKVRFIENTLVVSDYYNQEPKKKPSLRIGDIITHIAGKKIDTIIDSLKIYYPASNEAARLRNISGDLLRSINNHINIRYISSGQTKEEKLLLYPKDSLDIYSWSRGNENDKCYKLLEGNIGYITLSSITNEDIPVIKDFFKNTRGIIIDIRNYPNAFVPFSLGSYFVSNTTPFVKFTSGSVNNPGMFTFGTSLSITPDTKIYKGKLVVIVNELSQSQSEYTAMAFRAGDNTTIVGSQTAGADGNVSKILLPGGLCTMISGIGVYYPDGTKTQRIGIVPDIEVKPTIKGLIEGRDEVLERAIEIINRL